MPRRLCEPLCIAFGTSVSSPTAPTYQLYDLPHKLKPRLYMEAREPWRVVREMKGWEQAATAEASRAPEHQETLSASAVQAVTAILTHPIAIYFHPRQKHQLRGGVGLEGR